MNPRAQDVPDYYVWEVPGKPVAVHIRLSVVDRLSAELMRGYGANPKRNAEAGGVLTGSVEQGSSTIVRVEDFEVVPCQYRRGPSYIFTEDDCEPFEQAGVRPDAVGYFRSHTREGLSLGVEDIELLDHFFAEASTVALLIKPYATKACVAGCFIREQGTFPEATPLEFPFRRQELSGQEPPARRSMIERRPRSRDVDSAAGSPDTGHQPGNVFRAEPSGFGVNLEPQPSERYPHPEPAYTVTPAARTGTRSSWVWIPLSFVFLLLGLGLGYEAAVSVGSRPSNAAVVDFSLSLVVSKAGQNLSVHWDRQAPAVRASSRGVLEIEENGATKTVELDAAQLQNGTLTYRNATNNVHFRLTVFPKENVRVTEAADWRP